MEKAYITIILDKSGSMNCGLRQTISGYNEQVQAIKNGLDPKIETIVTFIQFNENVDPIFINESADQLVELDNNTYVPNGMTAMYDAVEYACDALDASEGIDEDDTSVLLVVISDGADNRSRCDKTDLAERIQSYQATGRWTITYMGANQDLGQVKSVLSVDAGNITTFDASNAQGYAGAMANASAGLGSYMATRSVGQMKSASFYADPNDVTAPDPSVKSSDLNAGGDELWAGQVVANNINIDQALARAARGGVITDSTESV